MRRHRLFDLVAPEALAIDLVEAEGASEHCNPQRDDSVAGSSPQFGPHHKRKVVYSRSRTPRWPALFRSPRLALRNRTTRFVHSSSLAERPGRRRWEWYNGDPRLGGTATFTPANVLYGRADQLLEACTYILACACACACTFHRERFVTGAPALAPPLRGLRHSTHERAAASLNFRRRCLTRVDRLRATAVLAHVPTRSVRCPGRSDWPRAGARSRVTAGAVLINANGSQVVLGPAHNASP